MRKHFRLVLAPPADRTSTSKAKGRTSVHTLEGRAESHGRLGLQAWGGGHQRHARRMETRETVQAARRRFSRPRGRQPSSRSLLHGVVLISFDAYRFFGEADETRGRRPGVRSNVAESWREVPPTTINVRSESTAKAGMWKRAFERHRCLVTPSSFFEWKRIRPKNNPHDEILLGDHSLPLVCGVHGRIRRRISVYRVTRSLRRIQTSSWSSYEDAPDPACQGL